MPNDLQVTEKNAGNSDWFTDFEEADFEVNGTTIHARFESRAGLDDKREPLLFDQQRDRRGSELL